MSQLLLGCNNWRISGIGVETRRNYRVRQRQRVLLRVRRDPTDVRSATIRDGAKVSYCLG